MTIVILGDGDFPKAVYPLNLLNTADILICCDGSILKLLQYNKEKLPHYIVGDMDTLPPVYQEQYKERIRKSACQETNDQTKAFNFAKGLIPATENTSIHILGATGMREDHTLGNISLLLDYAGSLPANATVDIITDYGIFTPHFNTFTAPCTKGRQISIFSFDQTLKIKSAGLLYPTDHVIFDLWWKATLNESTESSYTLTFSHPAKVLVFENYPSTQQ
ncbi:MAG: thiamine diphosphokinase [Bacteroidales bacterium]